MRTLIALVLFTLTAATALAALPPEYQRERELSAVFALEQVDAMISQHGDPVVTDTDIGYDLRWDTTVIRTRINFLPMPDGLAGPAEFEAEYIETVVEGPASQPTSQPTTQPTL